MAGGSEPQYILSIVEESRVPVKSECFILSVMLVYFVTNSVTSGKLCELSEPQESSL